MNLPAATLIPFTQWGQLQPFVAELCLIGTVIAILITPFFARRANMACAAVALAGLAVALIALLTQAPSAAAAGHVFRGMLVSDAFAVLWKCILIVFVMGIVLMWFSTSAAEAHEGDGPEFFTLLIGATIGMCVMGSTSNLLMLFMGVEMASLPSYILSGFRKTDRIGSEASLKYVLFGAATSAVMAYGLSMLYGLYGTLNIEELAPKITASAGSVPLVLGVAGILVGVGFKISIVPLHFWCPDVFEGAGIDVSAFLSVASKGAGLTLLLRVLSSIAAGVNYQGEGLIALAAVVGTIGAVTATVGNCAALVQTNIKRLLAYSSIAHAGYMLCALSLLVRPADSSQWQGMDAPAQAILIYLAVYLFMNLGAFTVAGLVKRATGSENIADYAALGRRNSVLALCMAVFMFSLVGLPPCAGFAAKWYLMWALAQGGGYWWLLVGVIGVNTVISLYYYARVIKAMYLTENDLKPVESNPLGAALCVGCAAMLVLMLIMFQSLQSIAQSYGRMQVAGPAVERTAPADHVASAER